MVVASLNIYAVIMYYMQLFVKRFSCMVCPIYAQFDRNSQKLTPFRLAENGRIQLRTLESAF